MRPNPKHRKRRRAGPVVKPGPDSRRLAILEAIAAGRPIAAKEYRYLVETEPKAAKGHKYHAKPVRIGDRFFASTAEAKRFQQLELLQRGGQIHRLECQPKFQLWTVGENAEIVDVGVYVADFRYLESLRGVLLDVVEDVKGKVLPLYLLKRKLFLNNYPALTFREINV